ncbi:unnamed protein product, partial [Brassica oleracea var. botrytis]
ESNIKGRRRRSAEPPHPTTVKRYGSRIHSNVGFNAFINNILHSSHYLSFNASPSLLLCEFSTINRGSTTSWVLFFFS